MNETTQQMTRYLLGELSEQEQTELEARYFAEPLLFDTLADVETALVDDYVRGRLPADTRLRFESHYLSDPRRRARVRFAQALISTIDRNQSAAFMGSRRWRVSMAVAATIAIVVAGAWLFRVNAPTRQDSTVTGASGAPPAAASTSPANVSPEPALPPAAPAAIVTFALAISAGERSPAAVEPVVFAIPPGTDEVRLILTLADLDSPRYGVIVRAIGGAEVLSQRNLQPLSNAGQRTLSVSAPAQRFAPGDYLLTLQGSGGDGYEDLSQVVIRVR